MDNNEMDMYEFKWRLHDPKIGKFWQVDPLADQYVHSSPYAFSENKVTNHIELEGLEAVKTKTPAQQVNTSGAKKNEEPHGKFSATATFTIGSSIGLDFEIKGTPYNIKTNVSAGEKDLIGFRDNNLVFNGKTSDGTKTTRSYAGAKFMILGKDETVTETISKKGEYDKSITKSNSVTYVSQETTYYNVERDGGQTSSTSTYIGFKAKVAFIIGAEIEVKIPIGKSNYAELKPDPYGARDATYYRMKIPLELKKE